MSESVYILIPAYNESKTIGGVIRAVQSAGFPNIVVVNDGSNDNTATIARAYHVEVIDHLVNLGAGAAFRTAVEYVRETYDPDLVVTIDADGQHDPQDIKNVIAPILRGEVDVVLGSRFMSIPTKMPFLRKVLLRCGVVFTNVVSHIKLTDTHNGFRAMNRHALSFMNITEPKMEHGSEIIDIISRSKLRYKEVPIHVSYTAYSLAKGQKNINFIKIGIKFIIYKLLRQHD